MGNVQVPPGCQRAPARSVEKVGDAESTAWSIGGVRGNPPQFGSGCGFHGGPDTGYATSLGDDLSPECTTRPSFQSSRSAQALPSQLGQVDVTALGKRSNVGNEGCIYHCGVPVQLEKVAPCEPETGQFSPDRGAVPNAEASLEGPGALATRFLSCTHQVPGSSVSPPQEHPLAIQPREETSPHDEEARAKFESWDFPFEAQPTLLLARFKALPVCGRRPQAPNEKVVHDDEHEFGWLAALLGDELPCAASTVLGVGCCDVGSEALAGSRTAAKKLAVGVRRDH